MTDYTPEQLRKIDALLAEKVMGWEYVNIRDDLSYWKFEDIEYLIFECEWKPTRQIRWAWQVVVKMYTLDDDVLGPFIKLWDTEDVWAMDVNEAAEFISVNALKALGVDVEKELE